MKIDKSRFCLITLKIYYSIETVHEGKKPFKCNICNAGFVRLEQTHCIAIGKIDKSSFCLITLKIYYSVETNIFLK